MPYIGDDARGQAISQKSEQFADVMDGGYIAHVWLRDGALILESNWLGCPHGNAPEPDLQRTLCTIGNSNQRYELALDVGVAVDVGLSSLD